MVHHVLPKNLSINIRKFLPRPQFFCLAPALPSTVLNLDRSAVISVTAVSVLAWKQVAEGEERDLQELLKLRIPKHWPQVSKELQWIDKELVHLRVFFPLNCQLE